MSPKWEKIKLFNNFGGPEGITMLSEAPVLLINQQEVLLYINFRIYMK